MPIDLDRLIKKHSRGSGPRVRVISVFSSGLKQGQLWGFAQQGYGIGFSLGTVTTRASFEDYLGEAERIYHSTPSFDGLMLDCGAVQEMDLATGLLRKRIEPRVMDERMERYLEAARRLPGGVFLVTPDKLGDQLETRKRFERQAARLRKMIDLGACLLLALQPGPARLWDLDWSLRWFLRGARAPRRMSWEPPSIIPAFPMRGTPTVTRLEDLLEYVRRRRPRQIHLLGMGPKNPKLLGILESLASVDPQLRVSLDATLLRAVVGRAWSEQAKASVEQQMKHQWRELGLEVDDTEEVWGFEEAELAQIAERAGVPQELVEQIRRAKSHGQAVERFWSASDQTWGALDLELARASEIATPKFESGVSQRDRRLVHRVFERFKVT